MMAMAVKKEIGLWVMFSLKFPALWRSILSLWPEMTDLQPRLLPAWPLGHAQAAPAGSGGGHRLPAPDRWESSLPMPLNESSF